MSNLLDPYASDYWYAEPCNTLSVFSRGAPLPVWYCPRHASVGLDLWLLGIGVSFLVVYLCFLFILPTFRFSKHTLLMYLGVGLGLFLGLTIMLGQFGYGWQTASVETLTEYSASNKTIRARVGVHIGLTGFNVTLKGIPVRQYNETIDYNEHFDYGPDAGIGIGYAAPNAGVLRQETRAAHYRGAPYPILYIVEYFHFDVLFIRWGRYYRQGGYYAQICLWTAFPLWLIACSMVFFNLTVSAWCFVLMGALMIIACAEWAIEIVKPRPDFIIPFPGGVLHFEYSWCFYLTLVVGIVSLLMGLVLLYLVHTGAAARLFSYANGNPISETSASGDVYKAPLDRSADLHMSNDGSIAFASSSLQVQSNSDVQTLRRYTTIANRLKTLVEFQERIATINVLTPAHAGLGKSSIYAKQPSRVGYMGQRGPSMANTLSGSDVHQLNVPVSRLSSASQPRQPMSFHPYAPQESQNRHSEQSHDADTGLGLWHNASRGDGHRHQASPTGSVSSLDLALMNGSRSGLQIAIPMNTLASQPPRPHYHDSDDQLRTTQSVLLQRQRDAPPPLEMHSSGLLETYDSSAMSIGSAAGVHGLKAAQLAAMGVGAPGRRKHSSSSNTSANQNHNVSPRGGKVHPMRLSTGSLNEGGPFVSDHSSDRVAMRPGVEGARPRAGRSSSSSATPSLASPREVLADDTAQSPRLLPGQIPSPLDGGSSGDTDSALPSSPSNSPQAVSDESGIQRGANSGSDDTMAPNKKAGGAVGFAAPATVDV